MVHLGLAHNGFMGKFDIIELGKQVVALLELFA